MRFSPIARDQLALDHARRARASSGGLTLSTCLPLRVLARHSSSATTKPLPCCARDQELAAALVAEHGDDVGFLLEVDEQPHRLAVAAPARQLRRLERVEAAVGGEHQELRRRLGRERELQLVVGLERDAGQIG